jgi:UDP-N-acetyl-alpha-D-muramoyl-L-alanyl-L-glutamate epimerase
VPESVPTAVAGGFDPSAYREFRFTHRSLDQHGVARLGYSLDDQHVFEEQVQLPVPDSGVPADDPRVQALLSMLHWIAGVSYYKAAVPPVVVCETGDPPPATARLLEALYSEGLGEFAVVNDLPALPRPSFPSGPAVDAPRAETLDKVLVPVGGGKDSAVAVEIVRRSGLEMTLFSVGDATPIARTAEAAQLPRLVASRRIDPAIVQLNQLGALNGHVPITAIVSCIALLTAALHGHDGIALANERSASAPNTIFDGVPVNHQFSKSARVEALMARAVAETGAPVRIFSILRPASELSIARAFARMERYHHVFTSCNTLFRLDPELRGTSWCGNCDKCRFVFLILAPFMDPQALSGIFGKAMLDADDQYEGFALLTATGGHKPFECVGEVEESVAAMRLLADDERWREQRVVRRLRAEVLPLFGPHEGLADTALSLSEDHAIPAELVDDVHAILGT